MIGSIQQAVVAHDRYQIELKLDYELFEGKQTRYRVETYIFVPRTLSIHKDSYQLSEFYGDIQNYIRLKTPTLILRDFCESPLSPLRQIQQITEKPGWVTTPGNVDRLVEHFKLLTSMLKSAIREHIDHLRRQIKRTTSDTTRQQFIESLTEEFLNATGQISSTYRKLFVPFSLPGVNEQALTGYRFADESISLLIEEGLIELWQMISSQPVMGDSCDFQACFTQRIQAEATYRQRQDYPSILSDQSDNEEYQFRASVLKKYASSVLFLTTDLQREGRQLEHMVQALAAGIAMIFATAAAFYAQMRYGNLTAPFFAALVVGYMFKDRIKEAGRNLFLQQLHKYLYDRRIRIYTQDGKHHLGMLREKVTFIQEADLPRRVREARNYDQMVKVDNDGLGENIICYTKDITLYSDTIRQVFGDTFHITGINDIIRYDIRTLLPKMDDPVQTRFMLKDEELHSVPVHKVYHVNLISKYATQTPTKDKVYKRHRLILNRSGIKRIEQVSL